jgi:L-lactate dehydrogenase
MKVGVVGAGRVGGAAADALMLRGAGLSPERMRFRASLGAHLQISPKSVHAYVLGEHGESEVLCWSVSDVGGSPWNSWHVR